MDFCNAVKRDIKSYISYKSAYNWFYCSEKYCKYLDRYGFCIYDRADPVPEDSACNNGIALMNTTLKEDVILVPERYYNELLNKYGFK